MRNNEDINSCVLNNDNRSEIISMEKEQILTGGHEFEKFPINLIEQICKRENLNRAYRHVKKNNGTPGIDETTIAEFGDHFELHLEQLIESLLEGTYEFQPLLGADVPKKNGGERLISIPTVRDRVVDRAIHQVLAPLFDKHFSESSYGFRSKHNAHQALKRSQDFVLEAFKYSVRIDLASFFDNINHDLLMSKLSKIQDERVLKIIQKRLKAKIVHKGLYIERSKGIPQGSPLSPLLANIFLDELDKSLEGRGLKFCRFADDIIVFVSSKSEGKKEFNWIKGYLEGQLKLKVNEEKSLVALVSKRNFLGFKIHQDGGLSISSEAMSRVQDKAGQIAKNAPLIGFDRSIYWLKTYFHGWTSYFCLSKETGMWRLNGWISRCLHKLSQKKISHF